MTSASVLHLHTAKPSIFTTVELRGSDDSKRLSGDVQCGRHLNGFADRPPVRPNISLGDTLAGLHAAFGVVMALLHRQRHNNSVPGQVSRISLTNMLHHLLCSGVV